MADIFTDFHAHLSMLEDRGIGTQNFLNNLFSQGFGGIIDVGTEADDLDRRLALFQSWPAIRFSAGIWPSPQAMGDSKTSVERLKQSIERAPRDVLVALGECGLDRFHNRGDDELNRAETQLFELQLQLALELDLPVIVHSRDAAQETLGILQRYPSARGVIHCFSYGKDECRRFLDAGWYLSFAGNVTYKNAEGPREALRFVPDDRLLLETDSPYLSPVPHRGKSATPRMVEVTYRFAAELRLLPVERLTESVRTNGSKLFGFPTPP